MALDLIFAAPSFLSKSFTNQETTAISVLFQEIASLLPPQSLQTACAMPPPDKNGAVGVVVQPSSETTVTAITPYGMLLLSLNTELDVSSAESLTNFIKERMEGAREMEGNIIAGPFENTHRLGELEDQEKLLYTLREIAETSEDAESVRVAFIALTTTAIGQTYIRENPIKL
jgi:hypothetical protein